MSWVNNDQSNISQDYGLSESMYSFGYDLRLKHSSFMQDTLDWVSINSSSLLPEEHSKVLSLGCGSGIFDSELIQIIQQHNVQWSFKGLDFSRTDLDYFQDKIATLDRGVQKNITLQYKKFTSSIDLGERYDLITMIHFLHSFDNVLPIIKNSLNHLLPDGKLLIVQQTEHGIAELKAQFSSLLPNQKFHSSEKIKALLKSENIIFSCEVIDTAFDVSILRQRSLDALLLMSFCFSNDLSVLTSQQQDKIRKAFLIRAVSGSGRSLIFEEQMEVIICQS